METKENILEKTVDLIAFSNQQLKIKKWDIYLAKLGNNGWLLPHFLENARLLRQSMSYVKQDFEQRKNAGFDSEDEKNEHVNALKKIIVLREVLSKELLELMRIKEESHKNQVLYNDVKYKLTCTNELFDLVRTRLENSGMPEILDNDIVDNKDMLIINQKKKIKYVVNKCKKINLRLSQYELAYILVTLKTMKLIGDYIGRKFDANLFVFIQNHFMCLSTDKQKFVPIVDFKSTISKVTRTVSIGRNEKIHQKHEELLSEAYKVLGLRIEQYNNTQLIDEEKE